MAYTGMIDLHCDTLIAHRHDTIPREQWNLRTDPFNIALEKMPRGTRWAQCFAVYIVDTLRGQEAKDFFARYYGYYCEQMAQNSDLIAACRSFADMEAAFAAGKFASLLTVEGGAVLAGEKERVKFLADCGVRMLTLTWNGKNELASGHDTAEGFSDFGRWAVPALEKAGILIDVSHLNDPGFDELCTLATRPLVASHSNARAICSHRRNLTDAQIGELVRRKGLIGLNYCVNFIKDGGKDVVFDDLYRHIEHILALGGEDVLCLGSDFDGAPLPEFLSSVEQALDLYELLLGKGLSREQAEKIMFGNAYRFFAENL